MSAEAKCKCQFCNQHIAFPVEMAGQMFACPHCGLETKLFIPQTDTTPKPATPINPLVPQPKIEKPDESSIIAWSYVLCFLIPIAGFFFGVYLMAKKKSGHGAACMAISIVLGLGWLAIFSHGFPLFDKQEMILKKMIAEDARIKPDENLRAVQGAYGWNLGDILPSNFKAETNDDSFGIISFGNLGEPESGECVLTLTEDRRIAAIDVDNIKADQCDEIFKTLKEKYGEREIHHHTSDGTYTCYFGPANRQAVLNTLLMVSLQYRDEELFQLAKEQTRSRRAAAKSQVENDLKKHL